MKAERLPVRVPLLAHRCILGERYKYPLRQLRFTNRLLQQRERPIVNILVMINSGKKEPHPKRGKDRPSDSDLHVPLAFVGKRPVRWTPDPGQSDKLIPTG